MKYKISITFEKEFESPEDAEEFAYDLLYDEHDNTTIYTEVSEVRKVFKEQNINKEVENGKRT